MKLHLIWIIFLLTLNPVLGVVNGANLFQEDNEVTTVPDSDTPVPREVDLWFRISPAFDSGTIDASRMTTSFNSGQNSIPIDMSKCSTQNDVTFCKQPGLILKTFRTNIPITFNVFRGGSESQEIFTISLNQDGNGPTVSSFKINDCTENCYVKTGENTFEVGISDEDGISLSLVPIDVTNSEFILPSYCSEGICYYSTNNFNCRDGERISFVLDKDRVLDNIGNGIEETITKSTVCDSSPPLITMQPELVDLGPIGQLVDSVEILFRAKVSDSTRVSIKVDFTGMDGSIYESDCVFTEGTNQICEVEARSPAGPQTGQVKVTLTDAAGNSEEFLLPIEVFGYEEELVPEVQIKNVEHRGSVSRMLFAAMNLRGDEGISYPVFFDLDPSIGRVVHVEVDNCNEGIIDGLPTLATREGFNHRLDFKLDTDFPESVGTVECNLLIYLRAGNNIFRTPSQATLSTDITLRGTDYLTPGERVHEKITEGNNNALKSANLIEKINNLLPVLRSICSINQAVGVGEQVGAAMEAVGLATQYIDGGALKANGYALADMALRIHTKLGDHGNDLNNQEATKNAQKVGSTAESFETQVSRAEKVIKDPKKVGQFSGWAKKACTYITCENMRQDQGLQSMADVTGYRDAISFGWDQLSAPNPGDSLWYAYEQGCYPAIIKKANDFGQYICAEQYCLKSMAANGGDVSICSNIKAEGICREVMGASVEMVAYQIGGTSGKVITAMKNLKDRIVGITINAGLGTALTYLEDVTISCQEVGGGDAKIIGCHIPYAIRLFIQGNEQAQQFGEFAGPSSNLCTAATCEGNECIGVIPTQDTITADEIYLHRDRGPLSNQEIQEYRKIWDYDPSQTSVNPVLPGLPSFTSKSYPEFVELTDDVQVRRDVYDRWQREGKLDSMIDVANEDIAPSASQREIDLLITYNEYAIISDDFTPDRGQEIVNIMEGTFELSDDELEFLNEIANSGEIYHPEEIRGLSREDAALIDEYNDLLKQQDKGLEAPVVQTSEDWNKVVPACNVDKTYCGAKNPMYFRDGKTLVYDSEEKKFKAVYDPNNLAGTYNLYRQVGSKYVNAWFENQVIGDLRSGVQSLVNRLDPYSAIEENFCELANNIDPGDSPEVFEMTSNGLKQFHFNAEKQKIDETWYYTFVYFLEGFNDREEGYTYTVRLKGGSNTVIVGQGKVLPGQTFRPDITDPRFRSVRAYESQNEYDNLCFEFRPAVTQEFLDVGGDALDKQEFCKRLSSTGFSGLGDAYNPGNNLLSYGQTDTGIGEGGVRWN